MNNLDYWHIKLMEECNEVSHRCSKILQFGPEETQDGHEKNNAARMRAELLDLLSVLALMEKAGAIEKISGDELAIARNAKSIKLAKYYDLSFALGRIEDNGYAARP
jgi:hypothetical protein